MVSYSQNLREIQPTPLDPSTNNVWGTLLNTNVTMTDTAIAGVLGLNVAGNSNIILTFTNGSSNQSLFPTFVLTGVLTGSITILWPNGVTRSNFSVVNNSTGAFTVTLAVNNGSGSPAGTTAPIVQGASGFFYSDGTNIVALGTPSSAVAGGDLTGTYPNPTLRGGVRVIQSQFFSATGSFTFPAGTTAATVFQITAVGGGGGGGGSGGSTATGGGGAAGGSVVALLSGFTAGNMATITCGALGAGGAANFDGSAGAATKFTYAAVDVITANGGNGGLHATTAVGTVAGVSPGTTVVSVGVSGLTLISTYTVFAGKGEGGISGYNGTVAIGSSGQGGDSLFGTGGKSTPGGTTGAAGTGSGTGGAGAVDATGGAGTIGGLLIEWVL